MAQYLCGDVLLAPVALDNRTMAKNRPVVVIGTSDDGTVRVCPVSSKAPADAPCLPLSIDDFATGGLDLFGESYVMTSRVVSLRSGDVIGKKGRVIAEYLAEVAGRTPYAIQSGSSPEKKKPGCRRTR